MSDLTYAVEKLQLIVESLATRLDKRSTLADAWVPLQALEELDLTESTVDSVLKLIQSIGLEHHRYPVPIPSPLCVADLPETRLQQVAEFAVSALVDVATESGAAGSSGVQRNAIVSPANARRLRYRHLGWEGHGDSPEYLMYLQKAFPQYPEDVLRQWFQRHGQQGMELFAEHLDLERLSFRRESWRLEQLSAVTSRKADWLEVGPGSFGGSWLAEPEEARRRNWLVDQMARTGTWPTAPIVLEDGAMALGAPNARAGQPLLLEGHRRMAMLLNFAWQGKAAEQHDVWVARS